MATSGIRKKPLNLTKRTTRKLSSLQAYTRLYYDKKLKAIVNAKWEQHIAENPDLERKKGEALRHRNATIKEIFDTETDSVKAEVEKRREEGSFSEDEAIEGDGDDDEDVDAIERQRRTKAHDFQRKAYLHF